MNTYLSRRPILPILMLLLVAPLCVLGSGSTAIADDYPINQIEVWSDKHQDWVPFTPLQPGGFAVRGNYNLIYEEQPSSMVWTDDDGRDYRVCESTVDGLHWDNFVISEAFAKPLSIGHAPGGTITSTLLY